MLSTLLMSGMLDFLTHIQMASKPSFDSTGWTATRSFDHTALILLQCHLQM